MAASKLTTVIWVTVDIEYILSLPHLLSSEITDRFTNVQNKNGSIWLQWIQDSAAININNEKSIRHADQSNYLKLNARKLRSMSRFKV